MKTSLVITSISEPNKALTMLAEGCLGNGMDFILIGDRASPKDFDLADCTFCSLEAQKKTGLRLAELCPERSYSRKNIGYLLAMRNGSDVMVESDDDNLPFDEFWDPPIRKLWSPTANYAGWVNIYALFSDKLIWPRGLPLDSIKLPPDMTLTDMEIDAPIQQGLADLSPDVDAIHRLVFNPTGNTSFSFVPPKRHAVALDFGTWSPFNSQNTAWFKDAFPLMYLPAFCSFRMTDIWRSFVAQRIAWENGWRIIFHAPTMYQVRNKHNLMSDFALEVPGYLNNRAICEKLAELSIKPGVEYLAENMLVCYEMMVRNKWIGKKEIRLLEAWFSDLAAMTAD